MATTAPIFSTDSEMRKLLRASGIPEGSDADSILEAGYLHARVYLSEKLTLANLLDDEQVAIHTGCSQIALR